MLPGVNCYMGEWAVFLTSLTVGLFSVKAGCFVTAGRVLRSVSLPSLSSGKLEFILRKAYVGSSCVRFEVG